MSLSFLALMYSVYTSWNPVTIRLNCGNFWKISFNTGTLRSEGTRFLMVKGGNGNPETQAQVPALSHASTGWERYLPTPYQLPLQANGADGLGLTGRVSAAAERRCSPFVRRRGVRSACRSVGRSPLPGPRARESDYSRAIFRRAPSTVFRLSAACEYACRCASFTSFTIDPAGRRTGIETPVLTFSSSLLMV